MDAQRRAGFAARLIAVVVLGACGSRDRDEPPAPAPLTMREAFPIVRGNRTRTRVRPPDMRQTQGITGIEGENVGVLYGTSLGMVERYRVTDSEVAMVTPDGAVVFPVLRAPLRRGAKFAYAFREGQVDVPCEVEITRDDATYDIGGAHLTRCVELARVCRYPAGAPFTDATTHRIDEAYCPNVGRVRETMHFDPPPRGGTLPAERSEEAIFFRAEGAPIAQPPARFDCDALLLMPTDVLAACPGTTATDPVAGESDESRCTYRYAAQAGPIEVTVARLGREATEGDARAVLDALGAESQALDAPEGFAFPEGKHVVLVRATEAACPRARARLLEPLLRSLLR